MGTGNLWIVLDPFNCISWVSPSAMVSTNWVSTGPGVEEEPEESPEPGNEKHPKERAFSIKILKRCFISVLALFWFVFTPCIYEHQRSAFLFPCAIFKSPFEETVKFSEQSLWIWLGISPNFRHKELANWSNSLCTPHATRWQLLSKNYWGNICIPSFFYRKPWPAK